jgi:hypothetical protein
MDRLTCVTSRRIIATRAHLVLSNLILDTHTHTQNCCTSEKKQHLRVIDGRDTQDMRESRVRYLDDLHGVNSGVGSAAASMDEAAHGGRQLRTPVLLGRVSYHIIMPNKRKSSINQRGHDHQHVHR